MVHSRFLPYLSSLQYMGLSVFSWTIKVFVIGNIHTYIYIYIYIYIYGLGHGGVAVLLPGFAIIFLCLCLRWLYHHILILIKGKLFCFHYHCAVCDVHNNQVLYALKVAFFCCHITLFHYHHYVDLVWEHWTYKVIVRYILSSVCLWLIKFSQLFLYSIWGCVFSVCVPLAIV